MNYRLAMFLSKFRYNGKGFALQGDYLGGINKAYIRKLIIFFDFGNYTKSWRVYNACGVKII